MKKQIIWAVVAVLVLIGVYLLVAEDGGLGDLNQSGQEEQEMDERDSDGVRQRQPSSEEEVRANLPADLPLEEEREDFVGFVFEESDGEDRLQVSSASYTSTRSYTENVSLFRAYLADNQFEVIEQNEEPGDFDILASREGTGTLSVTVQQLEDQVVVGLQLIKTLE